MKKYLIKQNCDYADEFDTYRFFIKEGNSKKEVLESLINKKCKFPVERYFGTNEAIEFDSKEEFFNSFEVEEISEYQYDVLKQLFDGEFGTVLTLEDY